VLVDRIVHDLQLASEDRGTAPAAPEAKARGGTP
jgi:hypothetical protein